MVMRSAAIAIATLLFAGAPAAAPSSPFEPHWQDGKAELAGYRYRVTRYGEERAGHAVMITVTEPFSESRRVKADDAGASANRTDTFEAVKVNLVRDFQTGIYDYNTMTSIFVRSRDFSPVKFSFSSAEWCGHVYEEIRVDRNAVLQSYRSYFDGESGDRRLGRQPGGVFEDQLYVLLRGLRADYLRPGEKRSVPLLPGTFGRRLAHRPFDWVRASIERSAGPERITVPAGEFRAARYDVKLSNGRAGTFWVESDYPHRLVRWAWTSPGSRGRATGEASETAELAGSTRLAYWQLNGEGEERYLRSLGLLPGGR
jgi:hypothetical protein